QLDLGFEALAGVEDLLELEPLQPHAVGDQDEHGERVADAGPPRFPGGRITVDGELERRAAPDRVGICGPHLEQMIARLDIGEGDAALRAEIEPPVGQARHAVGEAIALRGGEIERAEVERQDVGPVAEVDALEEPIGLRSRRRRAEHLDARERHVRRPASVTTPYTVSLERPSSRDSTLKRMASGAATDPCIRASPPPSVATHTWSRASTASA